jgi:hypothetical protein
MSNTLGGTGNSSSPEPSNARKTQARKPKSDRVESKVLRKQKQPRSAKVKPQTLPEPTPRPTTKETVRLASGEERMVEIEATNDKEWAELVALAEGATALSLDQKDITHRTIAAIVALRIAHEEEWKPYCESKGMKSLKEAKSPFRPAVMWVLNQAKARTGENHTSKASMVAGAVDEYWEIERPNGMKPDGIPDWLDERGGYTKVYRDRLERLKEPKDKIAERYGRFLKLRPLEQRDIPEWLDGFVGEVVIAAHIDRNTGKLDYRSVWRPEGSAFWHGKLDQFIAARPDYGKAVEPVRVQRAEPMFDCDDREANAEHDVRSEEQAADLGEQQHEAAEVQSANAAVEFGSEAVVSSATAFDEDAGERAPTRDETETEKGEHARSRSKVELPMSPAPKSGLRKRDFSCELRGGCCQHPKVCPTQRRCVESSASREPALVMMPVAAD